MLNEMVNQIKKEAVRQACKNRIELKDLYPTKEKLIEKLNESDPILMTLLPRLIKLPSNMEVSSVDYIHQQQKSGKGKNQIETKKEVVIHVATKDPYQKFILKKDLDDFYKIITDLRVCFAFRLEDSFTTKEWYNYNY